MKKLKLGFYILIGILGFALLIIDSTVGHNWADHLIFYKDNIDAIEGILLIFFSGFNIGKMFEKGKLKI